MRPKLFDAWNILIASVLVCLVIQILQPDAFLPFLQWIPLAWHFYPVIPIIPGLQSVAQLAISLTFFLPALVGVWLVRRIIHAEWRQRRIR